MKAGRKRFGLTQEKFAEKVGLSTQTINDIEGCRTWVSDTTLYKLAEVLRVDVSQLFARPSEKDQNSGLLTREEAFLLCQLIKEDIDKRLSQFTDNDACT